MKRFYEKITLIGLGLILVFGQNTSLVKALEIVVTENGSGSSNEAEVQIESETNVTQTNDANVENNINVESETGDNSASGNTGGSVSIETGDANQNISVENSLNNSVVQSECCPSGDTNLTISENGSDSENKIEVEIKGENKITINQTANITNNIEGYANTGGNTANDNTDGSVSIETGNIYVSGEVVNSPINSARVVGGSGGGSLSAKIAGNGAGSVNEIEANFEFDSDIFLNFNSNIDNFINWDLNTGKNEANGNTGGDVSIETGDIDFDLLIKNIANIGGVDINCCDIFDSGKPPSDGEKPPEKPDDPGKPGDGDGDGAGDGDGDGAGTIASGVTTEGGGIIGLSDTSSELAQRLFFWAGVAMVLAGLYLITKETSVKLSPANAKKRK